MANFIPSKYQQAIFDQIKIGNKNICCNAVAGSGKTSTIVNALDIIPANKSKIFLAFNKAIVEELKKKIKAPNTEVKTLHSAGFGAMMATYKSKLDTYKYIKFLNDSIYLLSSQITIDSSDEDRNQFKSRVLNLLNFSRSGLASTKEQIETIADMHDVELLFDEAEVVIKMMEWGSSVEQCKVIDYTDMIWIPVIKNLRVKTYDWVIVDECQDLSPMQNKLFQMMIEPKNGLFLSVGDRQQSIQFFAGAANDSFDNIATLPNTIELPLSICYRCDSAIVERAKEFVPQIEAKADANRGIVEEVNDLKKVKEGDMILSRVNSSLVSVCMKYISAGIPAYIKGKDIGRNLINLIKRTKKNTLEEMFEMFNNELYKIQIKVSQKNKISMEEAKDSSQYIALQDKIECINTISFGCATPGEIILKIEELFKEDGKGICLSTIHKSKGLESDRVFLIDLDKWPLKKAMKNQIQRVQERNLQYVSITRAKKELYFVYGKPSKLQIC